MSFSRDYVVELLKDVASSGATELHLKVPNRPLQRSPNGSLVPITHAPLTPRDTVDAVFALCALAGLELPVGQLHDQEFAFGLKGVGRFRVYVYKQRGSLAAVVQRKRLELPTLAQVGMTPEHTSPVGRTGITLLCGARRSEAFAVCVADFNARSRGHVWTIESPIEWLHRDGMASIAQREVGVDVPDYETGIRQAMRLGVDLLAIDQVPDHSTAQAILNAAEHGVSCVVSVPAPTIEEARWWIARQFVGEQREDAMQRLDGLCNIIVAVPEEGPACSWAPDQPLREVG